MTEVCSMKSQKTTNEARQNLLCTTFIEKQVRRFVQNFPKSSRKTAKKPIGGRRCLTIFGQMRYPVQKIWA